VGRFSGLGLFGFWKTPKNNPSREGFIDSRDGQGSLGFYLTDNDCKGGGQVGKASRGRGSIAGGERVPVCQGFKATRRGTTFRRG